MSQSSHLLPRYSSTQRELLNINRAQSLDILLPSFGFAMIFALIWLYIFNNFQFNGRLLLLGTITLLIILAAWGKKVDFKLRTIILYMGLMFVGLDQLYYNGILSSGLLILAVTPLVITIHLGVRLGIVSLVTTILGVSWILSNSPFTPDSLIESNLWIPVILAFSFGFALVCLAGQLSLDRLVKQIGLAKNREFALASALEEEAIRFKKRVESRTQTIELSAQIGQKITSLLNEDELVREVVKLLTTYKKFLHTAIYLKDEYLEFDTLKITADQTRDKKSIIPTGYRIPAQSGLFKRVIQEKRSFWVNDLQNSDYLIAGDPSPSAEHELAVPILDGDQLIGILDIRQDKDNPFDLDDAFLLESVATQLSAGLSNARLYARAQKLADHQIIVNQIRNDLQSATSIAEAIKIAGIRLSDELNAGTKIALEVKR